MEAYVPGGAMLPSADHAARAFAEAFARLIRLAPRPAEVSTLDPAPSWAAWNHAEDGLWPCPEDPDVNLNEVAGPEWIDDPGRRARDRLRASESEAVIGHCDWLAGNLGWSGDALLVVHDWDSMTADSEAVLVGFAAALYSAVSADELATVEDTGRFLVAYCHARGREFSADELERSWAAGVWTRACDAKYQHAVGQPITSLRESEARELVTDNLRNQMRTICRIRPAGMAQQLRTLRAVSGEQARHAPLTSLTGPIGPGRRLLTLRAPLEELHASAHANGCTVTTCCWSQSPPGCGRCSVSAASAPMAWCCGRRYGSGRGPATRRDDRCPAAGGRRRSRPAAAGHQRRNGPPQAAPR